MKTRNLALAFLALIAVGCAKEQPVGENVSPAAGRTIEVNMPPVTKVALGEATDTGVSLVWSAGDQIAVIEGKGTDEQKVSIYELIGEGGTTNGKFEWKSGDAFGEVITDVVFPAKAVNSNYKVDEIQTYVEDNVDNNAMIMSWTRTSDEEEIMLAHKTSVLMFTIKGTEDQTVSFIEVSCGEETYKLKCNDPVALSADGKVFYVVVPGSTESQDYTVNINVSSGAPMVKSFTKTLSAGVIGRLKELTFTPFHNLKLGDVYGGGLVFELNGKDIKVISLDETNNLAWATNADYYVRIDDTDLDSGEEKAELFRKCEDLANYPAAAWCINKGEGWYLPALKELSAFKTNLGTKVEENQKAINNTLAEYGGTAITFGGAYYWTCDEYSEGNKARCYNLSTGGDKSTKTTSRSNRLIRAVKRITLAGGENPDPKPEIPEEPVVMPGLGDIYEGGLVFEVGSNYVKIISITQTKVAWSVKNATDVNVLTENLADGEEKCELFKALSNLSDYPAAEWCINKGEGWYLPSREEFKSIRSSLGISSNSTTAKGDGTDTQNAINEKLLNNGGDKFLFGEYFWTCDEKAAGKAIYARPCDNDGAGGSKTTERYVRAVKKITF